MTDDIGDAVADVLRLLITAFVTLVLLDALFLGLVVVDQSVYEQLQTVMLF